MSLPRVVLDAEQACDLSAPVREKGKVSLERCSERLLGEDRGYRHGHEFGAQAAYLTEALSQLGQFRSSNLAEVKHIERNDHGTATPKIRERHGLLERAPQREIWGELSNYGTCDVCHVPTGVQSLPVIT